MSRSPSLRVAARVLAACSFAAAMSAGPARAAVTVEHGSATSFDGTGIDFTLFVPDATPAPVIFTSHGWGGSRIKDPSNSRVKMLTDEGYAVLTWDQRGFGTSGGQASFDSQEFEVRDVKALIDLVASDARILTDAEGDPRMGMLGGANAGAIQLMVAAADERVDAIVPNVTWHDLPGSLKPNGVIKLTWDLILYGAGASTALAYGLPENETGVYDPHIHQSLVEEAVLNDWTRPTYEWFDGQSPKHFIDGATLPDGTVLPGINAPTLLIQGTSDTLFNLNQAIANYDAIKARGVPAKMIWFCGGFSGAVLDRDLFPSSCEFGIAQRAKIDAQVRRWFARYVKGDTGVVPGSGIDYQLQDGSWRHVASLPGRTIEITGATKVTNTVVPTSGNLLGGTPGGCRPKERTGNGPTGQTRAWATETVEYTQGCPAPSGVWIPVGTPTGPMGPPGCIPESDPENPGVPICEPAIEQLAAGTIYLGAPRVTVLVNSVAPEAYLFFKVIDFDTATGSAVVVDEQVTALKSTWPGSTTPRAHTIDLAAIAWRLDQGHELYLEVSPTSNDHASSRFPGSTSILLDAALPYIPPAA